MRAKSKDTQHAPDSNGSELRIRDGRVHIALSPVGGVVAAFGVCLVFLVAYAVGKRAAAGSGADVPPTMTAMQSAPASVEPQPTTPVDSAAMAEPSADDGLERLLTVPGGNAAEPRPAPAQPAAENHKYLWIQSIRAESPAAIAAAKVDAAEIQAFLEREGIPTVVTAVRNGIIISSREGFSDAASAAADRDAFRQRIEQLGRLYRKQGGRYAFNGCVWK